MTSSWVSILWIWIGMQIRWWMLICTGRLRNHRIESRKEHVMSNHGITAFQHFIDPRPKWHPWKSRSTIKGRHVSSFATVRTRYKGGGHTPWECYCCLRNVRDLLADGKTPNESRFGEPFKGPIILFGALVELSSDFCQKLKQEVINVATRYYQESFLAGSWSRGEFGKEIFWKQTWKTWKSWMHQICIVRESMQRKYWSVKKMMKSSSHSQMEQQNCQGETYEFRVPTVDRTHRWRWSPCRFVVDPRWFHLSSSLWTSSSTLRAEGRNTLYSTEINWCYKVCSYWSGRHARNVVTKTGMSIGATFCWILGEETQSSPYWKENLQKDTCGSVRDCQNFKQLPDPIMCG